MALPAALTREIAGRPAWVWGLAAAGGVGLGLAITRRKKGPGIEGATDPQTGDMPAPLVGAATTLIPAPYSEPAITSNGEWSRTASLRLSQANVANPFAVEQALAKYLSGQALTPGERDIVSTALRMVGPPPEGSPVVEILEPPPAASPVRSDPEPAPPPANNGQVVRFTMARFGGSLESAADHFFGDPGAWRNFRVGDDPSSGWLNDDGYRMLATGGLPPDTVLSVGPTGRIRD